MINRQKKRYLYLSNTLSILNNLHKLMFKKKLWWFDILYLFYDSGKKDLYLFQAACAGLQVDQDKKKIQEIFRQVTELSAIVVREKKTICKWKNLDKPI